MSTEVFQHVFRIRRRQSGGKEDSKEAQAHHEHVDWDTYMFTKLL